MNYYEQGKKAKLNNIYTPEKDIEFSKEYKPASHEKRMIMLEQWHKGYLDQFESCCETILNPERKH